MSCFQKPGFSKAQETQETSETGFLSEALDNIGDLVKKPGFSQTEKTRFPQISETGFLSEAFHKSKIL